MDRGYDDVMVARHKDFGKEQLSSLYEELGSISAMAEWLECSPKAVSNAMKRHGVEYASSRKYEINHQFFSHDHESASQFYWAGFLAASANVIQTSGGDKTYRIELNLGMKDKSHLEEMVQAFDGDIPVREVTVTLRGQPYQQVRLVVSSKQMVLDLVRFGIGPKKKFSYVMPEWLVEHEFVRDFVRGWVDGKGNFYTTSVENKERREFRTSGTITFLKQLVSLFSKKLSLENLTPSLVEDKNGLGKVRFLQQGDVEKIAEFLYSNSTVTLNRKMSLALQSKKVEE